MNEDNDIIDSVDDALYIWENYQHFNCYIHQLIRWERSAAVLTVWCVDWR
jgi:hypothetical protein